MDFLTMQKTDHKATYKRNIHIKRESDEKIVILAARLGILQKCDVIDYALSLAMAATVNDQYSTNLPISKRN